MAKKTKFKAGDIMILEVRYIFVLMGLYGASALTISVFTSQDERVVCLTDKTKHLAVDKSAHIFVSYHGSICYLLSYWLSRMLCHSSIIFYQSCRRLSASLRTIAYIYTDFSRYSFSSST